MLVWLMMYPYVTWGQSTVTVMTSMVPHSSAGNLGRLHTHHWQGLQIGHLRQLMCQLYCHISACNNSCVFMSVFAVPAGC